MDIEIGARVVTRNTLEIVTPEELKRLLETNSRPQRTSATSRAASFTTGQLITAAKILDMQNAGIEVTISSRIGMPFIHDKVGGDRGHQRLRRVHEGVLPRFRCQGFREVRLAST